MNKICKTCKVEKPIEQFSVNRAARDGRINSCKSCETKRVKAWSDANPEKKKAWSDKNRSNNLRAEFPPDTMQRCNKCGIEKLLSEFGVNSRNKFYVRKQCKLCVAKNMAKKYEQDPVRYRAKTSKWRQDNPVKQKEYAAAYFAENREDRNEHRRQYRLKNIEREKEKDRLYAKNNRAKVYAKNARRRAAHTQATPKWLNWFQLAQIEEFYELSLAKSTQTGIEHEVDHVVPLRGKHVRGLHVPWNLQILTQAENARKYNKIHERSA